MTGVEEELELVAMESVAIADDPVKRNRHGGQQEQEGGGGAVGLRGPRVIGHRDNVRESVREGSGAGAVTQDFTC